MMLMYSIYGIVCRKRRRVAAYPHISRVYWVPDFKKHRRLAVILRKSKSYGSSKDFGNAAHGHMRTLESQTY